MLAPAPRVVPTMDVSFGWPGLELTVPFLRREASNQRALHAARHQAAQVQQRALEEQRRLEHAGHEAARRQAHKAAAVKALEERLAKAEAAREEQRRLRTDVEAAAVEPAP